MEITTLVEGVPPAPEGEGGRQNLKAEIFPKNQISLEMPLIKCTKSKVTLIEVIFERQT